MRLAVAALLAPALAACASLPRRSEPRYHFEFELGPVRGQYRTFACTSTATDLETKQKLTAPEARARVGEEGKSSGDEAAPFAHLEVTVNVDPSGRTAGCHAAVYSGGKLLGSDRTIIRD